MKKQFLLLALMFAASGAVFAQGSTATPRIDQREARQQQRIAQGVKSGQLTPHETARLEKQQSRIQREVVRAKSDGVVTRQERRRIERHQDQASRAIHREKHDRQRRM